MRPHLRARAARHAIAVLIDAVAAMAWNVVDPPSNELMLARAARGDGLCRVGLWVPSTDAFRPARCSAATRQL